MLNIWQSVWKVIFPNIFFLLNVVRHFHYQPTPTRKLCVKFNQNGKVSCRNQRSRSLRRSWPYERQVEISHLNGKSNEWILSCQTVHNHLKTVHLRARRPKRVKVLAQRHRTARQAWALRYHRLPELTGADWANIPFVDETKIKLQSSDGEEGYYNLER